MSKLTTVLLAVLFAAQAAWSADNSFKLKSGDIVLFYGDSITDQRQYAVIIETYVTTRYPNMAIAYVNSGWGGDTVSGGSGGPIDTRLQRDIFAYHPNVVTVMLGMNDGGYKAESEANDAKYFAGYKHIIESIHQNLPQAQIWALKPSPYDDVTRPPAFPVSGDLQYNEVLRSFGKWIENNAGQMGVQVADMNTDMVKTLKKAQSLDPETAKQIVADHIHPSFGGHLVLAEEVLKNWQARPVVSALTLNFTKGAVKVESSQYTTISSLSSGKVVAWTEEDESLPLPFKQWIEMWGGGASVDLSIRSSDVTDILNQQPLVVKGMPSGTYSLKIDGASVGAFNNDQLAAGINLALLKTPATEQAMRVYQLANLREEIHNERWRGIEVPLAEYALPETGIASTAINHLDEAVAKKMREVARPKQHRFELVLVTDAQNHEAK